jgi:hypothetical protein
MTRLTSLSHHECKEPEDAELTQRVPIRGAISEVDLYFTLLVSLNFHIWDAPMLGLMGPSTSRLALATG